MCLRANCLIRSSIKQVGIKTRQKSQASGSYAAMTSSSCFSRALSLEKSHVNTGTPPKIEKIRLFDLFFKALNLLHKTGHLRLFDVTAFLCGDSLPVKLLDILRNSIGVTNHVSDGLGRHSTRLSTVIPQSFLRAARIY